MYLPPHCTRSQDQSTDRKFMKQLRLLLNSGGLLMLTAIVVMGQSAQTDYDPTGFAASHRWTLTSQTPGMVDCCCVRHDRRVRDSELVWLSERRTGGGRLWRLRAVDSLRHNSHPRLRRPLPIDPHCAMSPRVLQS